MIAPPAIATIARATTAKVASPVVGVGVGAGAAVVVAGASVVAAAVVVVAAAGSVMLQPLTVKVPKGPGETMSGSSAEILKKVAFVNLSIVPA